MEVQAKHKNARMSARKLRLIRGAVRGLPVVEARAQLQFMPGKAADIVLDVLNSVIANAEHNFEATADKLVVADVVVDGGYTMKRFNPVSKGMAHPIKKRTAHVTVVVEEVGGEKKKKRVGKKAEIETISAAEHVRSATEVSETVSEEKAQAPSEPIKPPQSAEEKATSKVKLQQQGGDKAKTHRRKSIGD